MEMLESKNEADRFLLSKAHIIVEFELQDLKLLLFHESIEFSKTAKIISLIGDLEFIRSFNKNLLREISTHQSKIKIALEIISVVEDLLRDTVSYFRNIYHDYKILDTSCFLRHSPNVADILSKIMEGQNFDFHEGGSSSGEEGSSNKNFRFSYILDENFVIGFEDKQKELFSKLIQGPKQLEVIPIIGTAGIGKTTLAKSLYNHSFIFYRFHFRAWTTLSRSYQKVDLLRNILSSIVNEKNQVLFMSEDDMGEKLYKCLTGCRYLIVIDDLWDIQAWNDLEKYFPRNENGSRILITSRIEDVDLNIRPKSCPLYLSFLTEDESWDLFKSNVYVSELMEIGKKIVARCKGLPLAIVVVAELVSKEGKNKKHWSRVAESIGSLVHKIMDHSSSNRTLTEIIAEYQIEFDMVADPEFISKAHKVVEFELENLELLLDHGSIGFFTRAEIISLVQHLKFIKLFIRNVQQTPTHQTSCLLVVVLEIKFVVEDLLADTDSYLCSFNDYEIFGMGYFLRHSPRIADMVKKIESVKQENFDVHGNGSSSSGECSSNKNACSSSILEKNIVIGFEDQQKEMLERLIGGRKQLEVIPIIGMAGIGKTTLATTLYNHSAILYQFHVRAWTSLSQSYQKKDLLHNILSYIVKENDPVLFMSEDDMGEKLYKCLMGNRYLIVIDDIWDTEAWNDLERYFPRNENGSRILMTSRIEDVALNIRPKSCPYYLPFLTEEKSWDLFQSTVFADGKIPEELTEIGKKIVERCKGLPLAIVVIAGLLSKEDKTENCWRQVAENIGSSINDDSKQLMETLALSYDHLPSSLKSCFLYLGSFREDFEIPKSTLIRSWIAEGFIEHIEEKRLEEVAEAYLLNLINRNLVMVAKKSPDGGIKSCYIHDLLRDLCLQKGEEKNFVQLVCHCASNSTFFHSKIHCASIMTFSDCPYIILYEAHFPFECEVTKKKVLSVYKFLLVLDLRHMRQQYFPEEILKLLHLKFLALQVDVIKELPTSIFDLWNLETFILEGEKGRRLELTPNILKMNKLRHFKISQELFCDPKKWMNALQEKWMDELRKQVKRPPIAILDSLQTFSQLCPSVFVAVSLLPRIPSLRKLGLYLTLSGPAEDVLFPNLSLLAHLEILKFEYQTLGMASFSIPHPQLFPPSLKKLTLIGSHAKWREISILAMLPNLEVLKLRDNFFSGPCWETCDDGFPQLKFLQLSHMDLQQWISSSSHFPKLQQLVLNGCLDLEQIPLEIGDIPTLQTIEVYRSSDSAVESAKEILEMQKSMGNEDLKVYIYQRFQEFLRSPFHACS